MLSKMSLNKTGCIWSESVHYKDSYIILTSVTVTRDTVCPIHFFIHKQKSTLQHKHCMLFVKQKVIFCFKGNTDAQTHLFNQTVTILVSYVTNLDVTIIMSCHMSHVTLEQVEHKLVHVL